MIVEWLRELTSYLSELSVVAESGSRLLCPLEIGLSEREIVPADITVLHTVSKKPSRWFLATEMFNHPGSNFSSIFPKPESYHSDGISPMDIIYRVGSFIYWAG